MRPNGGILGRGFEGQTIPIIGIPFYGPTQNSCPSADPCSGTGIYVLRPSMWRSSTTSSAATLRHAWIRSHSRTRSPPTVSSTAICRTGQSRQEALTQPIRPSSIKTTYGDTTYYMVTAPRLPLLMLIEQAGVPGPVMAIPDALLRVWIEDKYRRDLSPGEHVPFQLSPIGNPINLVGNMLGAIPVGIDDTVQQASERRFRPLGTADVYRPFGVGGQVYDADGPTGPR